MYHPETATVASDPPEKGNAVDIMVECDQAIGPYAGDRWRATLEGARERGIEVEEF